jgi:hypothetical protein
MSGTEAPPTLSGDIKAVQRHVRIQSIWATGFIAHGK